MIPKYVCSLALHKVNCTTISDHVLSLALHKLSMLSFCAVGQDILNNWAYFNKYLPNWAPKMIFGEYL